MEIINYFILSSPLEKTAFFCSILYVFFAARQNKFCWLFSIISTSIYIRLTFGVELYFETLLNVFYLLIAIKGLMDWNFNQSNNISSVHYKPLFFHFKILLIGFLLVIVFGFIAGNYTNQSLSFLDAFTTVFSFIASYMVIKKIIENWIYWIVIDAASVYLYYIKNLKLTAVLFFIFTILAFYGFYKWNKLVQINKSIQGASTN